MKEKLKDKKKVAALIAAVVILAAGLIIWAVFADGAKDSPQQDDTQTDAPAEETPKEELPDETVEEPDQPEEPSQDSGGYTGPSYLAGTVHDVQIPQEAEEVIVEYFDVYYNSLKNLKEQDLIVIRYYLALRGAENGVTAMVTPFFCVQGWISQQQARKSQESLHHPRS